MQIREPEFKAGDKVITKKGHVGNVIKVDSYHFEDNEYWYDVNYDEGTHIKTESFLKPYSGNYETEKKTVWDLKEGEECYSLTICGNVHHGFWDGSSSSIEIRDTGSLFLTREEAECEIERRKVETEMLRLGGRRNFKFNGKNYFIYYNGWINAKGINVGFYTSIMHQGFIYFDSKEQLNEVVKTIGLDRIKKYIFGVES